MFTKLKYLTILSLILCLSTLSVNAQSKSTENDTLTYDQLEDDYIRIDNELTAANESLSIEKERSKNEKNRADNCEKNARQVRRKTFWGSVKRTAQDIGIGIVIGIITVTILK